MYIHKTCLKNCKSVPLYCYWGRPYRQLFSRRSNFHFLATFGITSFSVTIVVTTRKLKLGLARIPIITYIIGSIFLFFNKMNSDAVSPFLWPCRYNTHTLCLSLPLCILWRLFYIWIVDLSQVPKTKYPIVKISSFNNQNGITSIH